MNVVRDLVRARQEEEEDSGPHFHLDLIIQRERLRGFQHLQSIAAPNCSTLGRTCNGWYGQS
jgi:hypothetical protein